MNNINFKSIILSNNMTQILVEMFSFIIILKSLVNIQLMKNYEIGDIAQYQSAWLVYIRLWALQGNRMSEGKERRRKSGNYEERY